MRSKCKKTVFCSEAYMLFCLWFWHSAQLPNLKKFRLFLLRDVGADTKIGQLPTKVFLSRVSLFFDTSRFSDNVHVPYCFQGYRYMLFAYSAFSSTALSTRSKKLQVFAFKEGKNILGNHESLWGDYMHVDQSCTCILFLYSRPTRSLRTKYPEQHQTYPRQAIMACAWSVVVLKRYIFRCC